MYEKKIPFDIDCGIKIAMEVIGGKRPSELHRLFADANARVIDQQLKELEKHGAIRKKIYAELPPHSEYSITDTGRSLIPVIKQLETWGDAFRPKMKEILGIED